MDLQLSQDVFSMLKLADNGCSQEAINLFQECTLGFHIYNSLGQART